MKALPDNFLQHALEKIRDVYIKICTNDDENTVYESDSVVDISIQRSITDGSFGIGYTQSDRISFSVIASDKLPKKTRITVYYKFHDGDNWERLGRFYCDSCRRDGSVINVTAYDGMYLQDKKLVKFGGVEEKGLAALSFPCAMQDMLDYIAAYRGLTCEFECQSFTVQKKPVKSENEYYTVRELLGYIAACHACNAKFSSEGRLIFVPFLEADAELTADEITDVSIDDSQPFTVNGIYITTDDAPVYIDDIAGSEYDEEKEGIIKCCVPFCSVEMAEYMWNRIGGLSYYGGTIEKRGAGLIECGDVIPVRNYKIPDDVNVYPLCITGVSYSVSRGGGFTERLVSEISRSEARNNSSGGTTKEETSAAASVEISTAKIRYGGEIYNLQRGRNKRIIAVSKGDKCTFINSEDRHSSEIEAAAAIAKGLDEHWTMEYDIFVDSSGYGYLGSFMFEPGTEVTIDFSDGTEETYTANSSGYLSSTYHKYSETGFYNIRMKFSCRRIQIFNLDGNAGYRDGGEHKYKIHNGINLYIGGDVEEVVGGSEFVQKVIWGEKVKILDGNGGGWCSSVLGIHEFTLPPFVETVKRMYRVSPDYLYIPKSCTLLDNVFTAEDSIREIEIESEGQNLTVANTCFRLTTPAEINVLKLPSRLKATDSMPNLFAYGGVKVVYFENGWTEIPSYFMVDSAKSTFSAIENRIYPQIIFIPTTVAKIGQNAFPMGCKIIYEGVYSQWENIDKAPYFNSSSEAPDIEYCGDYAYKYEAWFRAFSDMDYYNRYLINRMHSI